MRRSIRTRRARWIRVFPPRFSRVHFFVDFLSTFCPLVVTVFLFSNKVELLRGAPRRLGLQKAGDLTLFDSRRDSHPLPPTPPPSHTPSLDHPLTTLPLPPSPPPYPPFPTIPIPPPQPTMSNPLPRPRF